MTTTEPKPAQARAWPPCETPAPPTRRRLLAAAASGGLLACLGLRPGPSTPATGRTTLASTSG